MDNPEGKKRFLEWAKKYSPEFYALIKLERPAVFDGGLSGFGGWVDDISTLYKTYIPIKQQQDLFKVQIARANAGQRLLTEQEIRATQTAGQLPVQIRVSPEMQAQLDRTAAQVRSSTKLVTYGIIGAIGIALMFMLRKKRR